MAPSVLGIGIPASSSLTPESKKQALQEILDKVEADMQSSPYDWEMFYFEPHMEFDLLSKKLQEKQRDIVLVGVGVRTISALTPFFEKIVNTVHEQCPKAKFAFNTEIDKMQEACQRVLPA